MQGGDTPRRMIDRLLCIFADHVRVEISSGRIAGCKLNGTLHLFCEALNPSKVPVPSEPKAIAERVPVSSADFPYEIATIDTHGELEPIGVELSTTGPQRGLRTYTGVRSQGHRGVLAGLECRREAENNSWRERQFRQVAS
jgi:hypothetical protein